MSRNPTRNTDDTSAVIEGAAVVIDLYNAYRAAVTAQPYDPVAAGSAYSAWRGGMRTLEYAAQRRVLRHVAQGATVASPTTADSAAVNTLARLPLGDEERLRLMTEIHILLGRGVGLDALLAAMSRAVVEADGGDHP